MSNPIADFPTSIHTSVDLEPLAQQVMGSTNPTHSQLEGKQEEEIKAIQQKIGVGSSLPSVTGTVLTCSASGTSEWRVSTGGGGTGTLVETTYDVDMNDYGFGWTLTWTPQMVDDILGGTTYVDRNMSETTFAYFTENYVAFSEMSTNVCHIIDFAGTIYVCGDNVAPYIEGNWVNTTTLTSFATRPLYIVPTGTCNVRIHIPATEPTFMGASIVGPVHLSSIGRSLLEKVNVGCYNPAGATTIISFDYQGNCSYHNTVDIVSGLKFGLEEQTLYLSTIYPVTMELDGNGTGWQPTDSSLVTMIVGEGQSYDGWGNNASLSLDGRRFARYTLSEEEYQDNITGRKYHNHQSGIEGQPTIIEGDNTTDIKVGVGGDTIRNGLQYEIITLVSDLSGYGVTDPTQGVVFTCTGDVVLGEGDSLIQYNRGRVKIGGGECWFYTGYDRDSLFQKDLPISNDWLDIVPDMDNFICAYSNGNPDEIAYWIVIQDVSLINYVNVIPYFVTFMRVGSTHLHKQIIDLQAHGDVELHHQRVFACEKYSREAGSLNSLSLTVGYNQYVDDNALNINLNGGGVWSVNHRNDILPVSNLTEHYICTYNGGVWYYYDYNQPRLDTRFYNSISGIGRSVGYTTIVDRFYVIGGIGETDWTNYGALTGEVGEVFKCTVAVTLQANDTLNDYFEEVPADKYAIAYIYRGVEEENHLYTFFSDVLYDTIELAQASKSMPSVPPLVASHAMMVGRIIFLGEATDPSQCICESSFDTVFAASSNITNHNNLLGREQTDCHSQYVLAETLIQDQTFINELIVTKSIYFGGEIVNGADDFGNVHIDWQAGNKQVLYWGGDGFATTTVTFSVPSGPTNLTLRIVNEIGSGEELVFSEPIYYSDGNPPVWSGGTTNVDILNLYYNEAAYYGSALLNMSQV